LSWIPTALGILVSKKDRNQFDTGKPASIGNVLSKKNAFASRYQLMTEVIR